MRLTEWLLTVAGVVAVGLPVQAQVSAELIDLAARIHYGYYHGEAQTIAAAQAVLERLDESRAVLYYRDFAALRRAQLGARDRESAKRLGDCANRAAPAQFSGPAGAEARVLAAACAFFASDQRRVGQALALARDYDRDNPRIALIEAWVAQRAGDRAAFVAKLTAAVAAFEARALALALEDPDWGHAEALTALGDDALARGEARLARDLIEQALLLIPDFHKALELKTAMQSSRSGRSL